jgi:endonuclease/exonuclease/phosphatase family metal-dependent hydrolase
VDRKIDRADPPLGEVSSVEDMTQDVVIRLLSYNIHKGLGLGNRAFTLPAIRDALINLLPNVMFLQEVVGEHTKHASRFSEWPCNGQFSFLAEAGWPHTAYGKNAVYGHGHHGNAILSTYPIQEFENIDVSTNAFESRGILHAVLAVPGVPVPLHCMCVHLNLLKRGREAQLKKLCQRVLRSVPDHHPLIVAGDFNDWQENASKLLFDDIGAQEVFLGLKGQHAQTFPTAFPLLRLDRIYARGCRALGGDVLHGEPWDSFSDHAPLLAHLAIG